MTFLQISSEIDTNRIFIWVLCIIYSIYAIIRIYYRRIANRRQNHIQLAEKKTGIDLLNALIQFEVFTFVIYCLWHIFDPYTVPFQLIFPLWLRWFGTGTCVTALGFFLWSHHSLGDNFSPNLKIRENQRLVTSGAYQFVRHPMYTAFILLHIGVFLLTANCFIGVSWNLGLSVILWYRIPREETMMYEKFGSAYQEYMRHTTRLIPSLRTFRHKHQNFE